MIGSEASPETAQRWPRPRNASLSYHARVGTTSSSSERGTARVRTTAKARRPQPGPCALEVPPPPLGGRAEPKRGGPWAGPSRSDRTGSRSATISARAFREVLVPPALVGLYFQLRAEIPRSGGIAERDGDRGAGSGPRGGCPFPAPLSDPAVRASLTE